MTHVPITEASPRLKELVRRADAGERVVLTREGRDVAMIQPLKITKTAEDRAHVIKRAHAALQDLIFEKTCAARSQDFLQDEDGLPA